MRTYICGNGRKERFLCMLSDLHPLLSADKQIFYKSMYVVNSLIFGSLWIPEIHIKNREKRKKQEPLLPVTKGILSRVWVLYHPYNTKTVTALFWHYRYNMQMQKIKIHSLFRLLTNKLCQAFPRSQGFALLSIMKVPVDLTEFTGYLLKQNFYSSLMF